MKELMFVFGKIGIQALQREMTEDWIFHAQTIIIGCELAGDKNNSAKWISNNVPKKWVVEFKIPGKMGRPALYLTEAGMYFTISQAKTDIGYWLRDKIFEEVLPSIRKDGGYISPDATPDQLSNLQDRIKVQMEVIEASYQVCKDSGDERGIITLKSQLLNLTNRLDGATEQTPEQWLSISEVLERSYKLHNKRVQNSLATIGKLVKAEYEAETGLQVKETPKHVGSGHHSDTIKVYPIDWFERIEQIAVSYWSVQRKDKKTGEEYTLIDFVK